jgi:hypothetical protein
MKTYDIELQRIKSMSDDHHGLIMAKVDAAVATRTERGNDGAPTSTLSLTVENARVLFLLLKTQLADIDKRKGRSQR